MILAALALAVAPVARTDQYAMIYGPEPSPSCGTWVSARKDPGGLSAHEYGMWVIGLITGMNMRRERSWATGPDTNALFAWIDQYCATHPLDLLLTAANKLEGELEGRAHR